MGAALIVGMLAVAALVASSSKGKQASSPPKPTPGEPYDPRNPYRHPPVAPPPPRAPAMPKGTAQFLAEGVSPLGAPAFSTVERGDILLRLNDYEAIHDPAVDPNAFSAMPAPGVVPGATNAALVASTAAANGAWVAVPNPVTLKGAGGPIDEGVTPIAVRFGPPSLAVPDGFAVLLEPTGTLA